ncbi:MAG: hypothetical protein AB7K24_07305, partial [Gemmataceae bacterium]
DGKPAVCDAEAKSNVAKQGRKRLGKPKQPREQKATGTSTAAPAARTESVSRERAADAPLGQRYRAAKERHPGMLLLFRSGDYYELLDKDAVTAAECLGLNLTQRDGELSLAGFPHTHLEEYLRKLLKAGLRVAICDQELPAAVPATSDPSSPAPPDAARSRKPSRARKRP